MIIAQQILELLKESSKDESLYVNPNFLLLVTGAIEDYYGLEDDIVDKWVRNMFER